MHELEEVLLPKPRQAICVLSKPASDAPAEEWAEYRRQVEEVRARGEALILLVPMNPADSPRTENGVTYCDTKLDPSALKARMLSSLRGNKSFLGDVIKDLSGNVIGPVARDEG